MLALYCPCYRPTCHSPASHQCHATAAATETAAAAASCWPPPPLLLLPDPHHPPQLLLPAHLLLLLLILLPLLPLQVTMSGLRYHPLLQKHYRHSLPVQTPPRQCSSCSAQVRMHP